MRSRNRRDVCDLRRATPSSQLRAQSSKERRGIRWRTSSPRIPRILADLELIGLLAWTWICELVALLQNVPFLCNSRLDCVPETGRPREDLPDRPACAEIGIRIAVGVLQVHGLHCDHVPARRSCRVLENGALAGEKVSEPHQTIDAELVSSTSRWAGRTLVCPRGQVNEAIVSGKHCIDWYPVQKGSSDGEIQKQIPTSSGRCPGRPSPRDIGMSQWPWARLERRAVCAERCPYGSGRRSAYALLTPFETDQGWLYLATVMDLYSRKIVGWAMADHLRAELPMAALAMAIATHRPASA